MADYNGLLDGHYYMYDLTWLVRQIKDQGAQIASLPDQIKVWIAEGLSYLEINKLILEALTQYGLAINVLAPPAGLTPATADGTTDSTDAIQGCLDYAARAGGKVVFFPYGKYLTQPLTVSGSCALVGFDERNTTLFLAQGAQAPLLTVNGWEGEISGLTLDANAANQVNAQACIRGAIIDGAMRDVTLSNGTLGIDVTGGKLYTSGLTISAFTDRAIAANLTGADVTARLESYKAANVTALLDIGGSSGVYHIVATLAADVLAEMTGSNNYVAAKLPATMAVNDSGTGNYFRIDIPETRKDVVKNWILDITGDLTENAGSRNTTIGENQWLVHFPSRTVDLYKSMRPNTRIIVFTPAMSIEGAAGTTSAVMSEDLVILNDAPPMESHADVFNQMQNAGIAKIDVLTLSHYHGDHWESIPELKKSFDMSSTVFYLPLTSTKQSFTAEALAAIQEAYPSNTIIYPADGASYTHGNAVITFSNCGNAAIAYYDSLDSDYNNYSMCTEIKTDDITYLHTGDVLKTAMDRLSSTGQARKADIVTAPHHGVTPDDLSEACAKNWGASYIVTSTNYSQANDSGIRGAQTSYIHYLGADLYTTLNNLNGIEFMAYRGHIECNAAPSPYSPFAPESTQYLYVDGSYTGEQDGTKDRPFTSIRYAIQNCAGVSTVIDAKNINGSSLIIFDKQHITINLNGGTLSYLHMESSNDIILKDFTAQAMVMDRCANIQLFHGTLPNTPITNCIGVYLDTPTYSGGNTITLSNSSVQIEAPTGTFTGTAFYCTRSLLRIAVSFTNFVCEHVYRSYISDVRVNGNAGTAAQLAKYCQPPVSDTVLYRNTDTDQIGYLGKDGTIKYLA